MKRVLAKTVLPAHGEPESFRIDPVEPFKVADDSRCFLCGEEYAEGQRTDEHVFPSWLLNNYKLWDQKLTLLNGTAIPYRQVRIPCCRKCNNEHLSILENTVERAVTAGFDAFAKLPDVVAFQWLTKIFVQILRLETRLPLERSTPDVGFIVAQETLDDFALCHWLLSSVRRSISLQIADGQLWSIFRFRCQESTKDVRTNFDFMDNVPRLGIAIRMGQIGLVASLQDCGANWAIGRTYWRRIAKAVSLHPYQFREIACSVFYKQHTMTRLPKFVTVFEPTPLVIALPLQGLSQAPIFGDWDQAMYGRLLASYLPIDFDPEAAARGQAWTFIRDARKRFVHLPIDGPENAIAIEPKKAKRRSMKTTLGSAAACPERGIASGRTLSRDSSTRPTSALGPCTKPASRRFLARSKHERIENVGRAWALSLLHRCSLPASLPATTRLQTASARFTIVATVGAVGPRQKTWKESTPCVARPPGSPPSSCLHQQAQFELDSPVQTGATLKRLADVPLQDVLLRQVPGEDEVIGNDARVTLENGDHLHGQPPADYGLSDADLWDAGSMPRAPRSTRSETPGRSS
jgi:hypothetical protein